MINFSIDELTELFNILIGNMSIVVPRLLSKEYLSKCKFNEFRMYEATLVINVSNIMNKTEFTIK